MTEPPQLPTKGTLPHQTGGVHGCAHHQLQLPAHTSSTCRGAHPRRQTASAARSPHTPKIRISLGTQPGARGRALGTSEHQRGTPTILICARFSCVPKKCGPCTTPTWGGGCANNCGPGDSCCNDQCIPQDQFCCHDSPCPNQNLCCADGCKDPTDPQTCGTCDNACPPGTTCNNGSCNCGAGGPCSPNLTCCADTQNDNNNCGGCGNTCTNGTNCHSGTCSCGVTCPECYYTCCNDSCVFTGGAGCYYYSLETGICLTWTGCDQGLVTCGDPYTCPPWPGTC